MNKLSFELVKRQVLIKKESKTNFDYGKRPEDRNVDELIKYGIININKPSGPTSHQVVDYVKKILNIKHAGHSGTLDPRVTGVLPIALDKATRIVQVLLKAGKEYIGIMHLHSDVTESKLYQACEKFTGKIKQIPPIKSAVKRRERERSIYYFDILEINEKDILFRVGCEAGTYIRKLVHQIGQELKVGAHLSQLIRTRVGIFNDENWCSLQDLKDAFEFWKDGNKKEIRKIIKPFELGAEHLPKIWVLDSAIGNICHGSNLYVQGISKIHSNIKGGNVVGIFSLKDELICLGIAEMNSDEMLKEEKGTAIKTKKVFMDRNIYPR